MVDIRQDARFVDFLASKNMTVDSFEAADDDLKAALSSEIDEWKKENPLDIEEQEPKYTIEEAINIALNENLNKTPEELVALSNAVKEASNTDEEAKQAYNNIQKAIGIKAKQYAKGQIDVDIDNADNMLALLDAYEAGDNEAIKETKDKAKTRLDTFTKAYDDENGLTDLTPENSEYVDTNSTVLEGIGNEDLFETTKFQEETVVPMPFDKAKEILANPTKPLAGLSLQEFASLQASMAIYSGSFSKEDNYVVSKAARAKVLEVADGKREFNKEDFASFDFILSGVEKSVEKNSKLIDAKKLNKAKDILKDQREDIASTVFIKDPEMQEAYDVLSAVRVTGGLKRFSREEIQQRDENGVFLPNSEMGLFIESIKERTKQQMLTSKEEITPKAFKENFSTNLEVGLFELYGAERIALGKSNPKDVKETYNQLVGLSQKGKKISINQESFAGYAALKNKESNSFIKRLEKKTGNTQAVETSRKNNKELDKKNEQVHGDKYKGAKNFFRTIAKTTVKAGAWSAAFSVAATVGAPAVVAVASASLAWQVRGAVKAFKKEKIEAAKNGEKLSFWGYIKKNPAVGLGVFTSALGAAVPGLEILGEAGKLGTVASSLAPNLGSFRFGSSMLAAGAGAYKPIINAFKNPTKENIWGAAGAVGGFAMGMIVGKQIGDGINEYNSGSNSVDTSVDGISGAAVQVQPPVTTLNADMNPNYDYSDPSSRFNFMDANNNGVPDYLEGSELAKIFEHSNQQMDLTADANNNGLPDYLEVNAPEQTAEQIVEQTLETKTQPTQETPVQETPKEQTVETDNKQPEQTTEQATEKSQPVQDNKNVETETKEPVQTQMDTREDQPSLQPTAQELAVADRAMAEQDFQAIQTAAYNQTYTMTDSLGQTADYQVSPDGNIVFTNAPEGFTGHGDMGNDIAKDIMGRVENGTATEGDLKAIERYSGDKELLADAQSKFEAGKESFIAEKQAEYAENRVAVETKAETLADNKVQEGAEDKTVVEEDKTVADNKVQEGAEDKTVVEEDKTVADNKVQEGAEDKTVVEEDKTVADNKVQEGTEDKTVVEEDKTLADNKVQEGTEDNTVAGVSTLAVAGFDSRIVGEDGTVSLKNDNYSVSYKVSENGNISMSANGSVNPDYEVKDHCSKMYKLPNGNYKMGDSVSSNMSAVQMMANNDLRITTLNNAVYSDMEARVTAGEQLSTSEAKFMERHEAKLDRLGLHRDEDGKMHVGKESDEKANAQSANNVENTPKEPDYKISRDGTLTYTNNSSPEVSVPAEVKSTLAVEQLEDGRYKVGDTVHKNADVAMQKANLDLNNVYKNNDAYNDMAEKREQGVELDKRETKFMASHEKKMEAFNLTNKDGKIEVNQTSQTNDKPLVAQNTQTGGNQPKVVDVGIENRREGFQEAAKTVNMVNDAHKVVKGFTDFFR